MSSPTLSSSLCRRHHDHRDPRSHRQACLHSPLTAELASAELVHEKVQDGLTGETRDMTYTQCKIVGNGSFGVVFQTKLSPSGEDAAIKRVLQDKRFKVSLSNLSSLVTTLSSMGDIGVRC